MNELQDDTEVLTGDSRTEGCTSTFAKLSNYRNAGDVTLEKLSDGLSAQLKLNETKLEIEAITDRFLCYTLPPPRIDSLPQELMVKIFHHVLDNYLDPAPPDSYRGIHHDMDRDVPPIIPNLDYRAILRVCSAWRRLARCSKRLWTNIDIFLSKPDGFIDRAKDYALFSGTLPLHLRLFDDCDADYTLVVNLVDFVRSIARRVCSLELCVHWDLTASHVELLNDILFRCKPRTLKRLEIMSSHLEQGSKKAYPVSTARYFSRSGHTPPAPPPVTHNENEPAAKFGDLMRRRFEMTMSTVSVLRLNRMYPAWSSSAYHGLVELYLGGQNNESDSSAIPESSLGHICQSSPRLRVLHIGLKVIPQEVSAPIPLENLESLSFESPCVDTQQSLLRLISPGTKLSRVNIKLEVPGELSDIPLPEIILDQMCKCFARSPVTKFFFATNLFATVRNVLEIIPRARIVGLSGFRLDAGGAALCKELHSLHLRNGSVYVDPFKEFILTHQLKRVTVAGCHISEGGCNDVRKSEEFPVEALCKISPVIEAVPIPADTEHPTRIVVDGWDY